MVAVSPKWETIKTSLKEKLLFDNEPTPELFAILTVYFVQGILGLARLAVSFFLKDDLALSPAEVAALMGVASIPWIIKPIFGFLSDGLPLFGYRRRSYLILSGILGTMSWAVLATLVHTAWAATLTILVSSISVAISDVIVDSLVVERARKESLGRSGSLQSLTWGVSALGGLLSAYFSGWLLQELSNQFVFGITAIFPLMVSAIAYFIGEETVGRGEPHRSAFKPETDRVKEQLNRLWMALKQKSIWLPSAFLFLWQATPSADTAFFFFITNDLGFEPEFLGRVRLVTSFAALFGAWLYHNSLKNVSFRAILGWSTVISSALGMTALLLVTHANRAIGIDDRWFSLGDSLILTVMGQIAWMPVLVLSARLCPAGIEATLFALLMSIWNMAMLLSQELGALLTHWLGVTETNFEHLWILLAIANLSSLLPLPLLGWLPAKDPQEIENHQPIPPAEVFEHHPPGAVTESSLLPDLFPKFVANNTAIERRGSIEDNGAASKQFSN